MNTNISLLSPYKTIGLFLDNNPPYLFSAGKKSFMAVSCKNSYKIYKLPDMKIKLLGPHFPHKITAFAAANENLYISCKNSVYRMKFYHIEQRYNYSNDSEAHINSLLLLGDYLLASNSENMIILWDIKQEKPMNTWENSFEVLDILHPMTYLNKILIVGKKNLTLFNIKVQEVIYDFSKSLEKYYKLTEENLELSIVKNSPNLHIIAIGFSNGLISLHNIQMDTILFSFKQQNSVLRLAFSHNELPLLASSDSFGNINIWDLNERKIFSSMKKVHSSPITCLEFLETELILISGSGNENSLIQWKYDEIEDLKFRMVRNRFGLAHSLKKIRFYGEDGLHLIVSSNDSKCELRDISLLNECMSLGFSKKINKEIKKKGFDTENQYQINEILDFDFSNNRAKEWGTLLTCHLYSSKPCIWSCEDHTIIKKSLETIENQAKNDENLNFITAITVSNCGNFGVLGFKNGNISKINLQSGNFQSSFVQNDHKSAVLSLKINHYNKWLLSTDEENSLIFWDFFSAKLEQICKNFNSCIWRMELSHYSHLFLLIFEDFSIEIWDMYTRQRSRHFKGHTKAITEARFTPNNKFVISTSMDQTLKIWDVLSGHLINDIHLQKPIITFDISPDGEMLASAFLDCKEVNLWHVMIGMRPWGNEVEIALRFQSNIHDVSNKTRLKYYDQERKNEGAEIFDENEDFYKEFNCENNDNEFNLTQVSEGKWRPLLYLDLIKEKNKPKIIEKTEAKLPFFLDFENKDQFKEELKEIVVKEIKEKSKIISSQREKYMDEVGTLLDNFLEKDAEFIDVFNYMKSLTPSQLDYELRKQFFGGNIIKIQKMMEFFENLFESNEEFDLKQVYFKIFLEVFLFYDSKFFLI